MSHSHHDHGHQEHTHHHEPASSGSPNDTLAAVIQTVVENATELLTTVSPPVIAANHDHHAHHHEHVSDAQAAAPEGHDHSGHSMRMWFHGGCEEVILFDWWRISSLAGLIFSFLLIFGMATLYEGLKWFRVNLQTWADQANRERAIPLKKVNGKDVEDALIQKEASSNGGHLGSDQVYSPTVESSDRTVRSYRSILSLFISNNPSPFSPFRLLQTGIYCVQLTLAYWLMLVAMTYNTYLTAAVVLGAGFGHWLFAILKRVPSTDDRVDAFASDACH